MLSVKCIFKHRQKKGNTMNSALNLSKTNSIFVSVISIILSKTCFLRYDHFSISDMTCLWPKIWKKVRNIWNVQKCCAVIIDNVSDTKLSSVLLYLLWFLIFKFWREKQWNFIVFYQNYEMLKLHWSEHICSWSYYIVTGESLENCYLTYIFSWKKRKL